MADPARFILGEPIRIIGGKNKGHRGWLNAGNPSSNKRIVNIIVDLTSKGGGYKATWAKTTNVGPLRNIHTSYWEALLYCAPDVEQKMNEVAADLAESQLRDINNATKYHEEQFKKEKYIMMEMIGKSKLKVRPIIYEPRKRGAEGEAVRGDPMEGDV